MCEKNIFNNHNINNNYMRIVYNFQFETLVIDKCKGAIDLYIFTRFLKIQKFEKSF